MRRPPLRPAALKHPTRPLASRPRRRDPSRRRASPRLPRATIVGEAPRLHPAPTSATRPAARRRRRPYGRHGGARLSARRACLSAEAVWQATLPILASAPDRPLAETGPDGAAAREWEAPGIGFTTDLAAGFILSSLAQTFSRRGAGREPGEVHSPPIPARWSR